MADITLPDLTEGSNAIAGTGTFDVLMQAMSAHLGAQYDKQRIKGTDYATVYLGATQSVLQNAVQFLLEKDRAGKQADLIDAQIALAQQELANKIKEGDLLTQQLALAVKQEDLLDKQILLADKELDKADADIAKANAEVALLQERLETEYAQTHDTLTDNLTPVLGQLGKQNEVRDRQIKAFDDNHTLKSNELMQKIWMTMRGTNTAVSQTQEARNTDDDLGQFMLKLYDSLNITPPY